MRCCTLRSPSLHGRRATEARLRLRRKHTASARAILRAGAMRSLGRRAGVVPGLMDPGSGIDATFSSELCVDESRPASRLVSWWIVVAAMARREEGCVAATRNRSALMKRVGTPGLSLRPIQSHCRGTLPAPAELAGRAHGRRSPSGRGRSEGWTSDHEAVASGRGRKRRAPMQGSTPESAVNESALV